MFNAAMSGNSPAQARLVAATYDFSRMSLVVDVGGGHGRLLATILERARGPGQGKKRSEELKEILSTTLVRGAATRLVFLNLVAGGTAGRPLWHRLLGRPASESGSLCRGDGPTGGAAAPPEGGNVGYPLSREARRVSGGAAGSLRRAAVRQVGAAGPGAAVHRKHFAGDEVRLGRREEQGCVRDVGRRARAAPRDVADERRH